MSLIAVTVFCITLVLSCLVQFIIIVITICSNTLLISLQLNNYVLNPWQLVNVLVNNFDHTAFMLFLLLQLLIFC